MSAPPLANVGGPRLATGRCACDLVVDAVVRDLRSAVAEARKLSGRAHDRRKVKVVVWVRDGKVLADIGGVDRARQKPGDEKPLRIGPGEA